MKRDFKIGDIVREGTFVSSIKMIENGKAVLAKNYEVDIERLSHVEINGIYDNNVILDCIIPIRASLIACGYPIPIRKSIFYLEGIVDSIPVKTIIKNNSLSIITELQDWLSHNAPDYYLRTKFGI